jgi:hypothetical protein
MDTETDPDRQECHWPTCNKPAFQLIAGEWYCEMHYWEEVDHMSKDGP